MTLALIVSPTEQRVRELVDTFKSSMHRTLQLSIELGDALEAHKASMVHGEWLPWLEGHFELGRHMAEICMSFAEPANRERVLTLPSDTSFRAARKWLQDQTRGPRPINPRLEAPPDPDPLLRFMVDQPTPKIIAKILATCFPDARDAMDPTYGLGGFWDGSAHVDLVAAHDSKQERAPSGAMDVTDLKYGDLSFDVITLDPPHLGEAGDDSVMGQAFGTADTETIKRTIMLGTRECWRVCGIGLIVKVTDHVHASVYQLESDWVGEALDWQAPYEVVHQVRSHAVIDPKWGRPQLSAYNNGSTYLVFRRGDQRHVQRTATQAE